MAANTLESELCSTQRTILSQGSIHSMSRQQLAANRARLLLGCYRRSDAADPDTYIMAIAAVLACYEQDVIMAATDPRSGIQTKEKFQAFPPNSGELKAFCEAFATYNHRMRQYAAQPEFKQLPPPSLDRSPGRRAELFVGIGMPGYDEMVAKARDNADPADWCMVEGGIKVALNWYMNWRGIGSGTFRMLKAAE